MWEMIQAGGIILYLTLLGSVVAFGFTIERFITYRQARCKMQDFFPRVEKAIKMGKLEEAAAYCEKTRGIIPRLFLIGVQHREENVEDIRKILIDEVQIHILPGLQKYLGVLAFVIRVSPMLGLLGTVVGMIELFEVIGSGNIRDSEKLAHGIGLALVTTAGGLMVAIPFMFFHAYFVGRIRDFELDIFHYLTLFLRLMRRRQEVS